MLQFTANFDYLKCWCDLAFPLRHTERNTVWITDCSKETTRAHVHAGGSQRPQIWPPAVSPAWVILSHPSCSYCSTPGAFYFLPNLESNFSWKLRASVCALRSKCETHSQACGTGWQSRTAICYPHNRPIKRKNRMWWILRTLLWENWKGSDKWILAAQVKRPANTLTASICSV